MLVFSGTRSTSLGWNVSKDLKTDMGKIEVKSFPDGEKYVRIESDVRRKECAVIQSVRTNDDLLELILILDAIRDSGATQVHAVMPYLAYLRQDKRFIKGEALSAKTVLKIIDELADSITTVNAHFLNRDGETVYHHVRFMNLDAIPLLINYLGHKIQDPIVIAPDKGSLGFAKLCAHQLDCEFDHLSKTRHSGSDVEIEQKKLDVKGMDVILLDDIISTGGTIIESTKLIKRFRPASINVGCVHGLFLKGIEPFKGSIDRIISSDTLENPAAKVSVSSIIATDLKR